MLNLHFRTAPDIVSMRKAHAFPAPAFSFTPAASAPIASRHGPTWPPINASRPVQPGEPCAQSADRVFVGYCVPEQADFQLSHGMVCEAESGKALFTELLTDSTDREQQVFARLRRQWRAFEKFIPPKAYTVVARFRRHPIALLRLLAACARNRQGSPTKIPPPSSNFSSSSLHEQPCKFK